MMGLATVPEVSVVSASISPLLWVRRSGPLIVMPRQLVDEFSDQQICCVISHEIAHFLRRDHWTNLVSLLITALFWWHPVVWWARRELRTAQESCCDAMVISRAVAPRQVYAKTLFQALEFIRTERSLVPVLASGFGSKSSTQRRFEMIANQQVSHQLSPWYLPLLIAAFATLPCLPATGAVEESDSERPSATASPDGKAAASDKKAAVDKDAAAMKAAAEKKTAVDKKPFVDNKETDKRSGEKVIKSVKTDKVNGEGKAVDKTLDKKGTGKKPGVNPVKVDKNADKVKEPTKD